jgi:SPP1 gp7 family putative phage head morphogenesis protein
MAQKNELPDFADEIARICADIYKRRKGVHYDASLLAETAGTLLKGVYAGYGKDFISVGWDTPDLPMLSRLTQNVFSFSAAKNYQELRTITDALRDEDGKLRDFQDFKEEVGVINDKFNKVWLQTEYDTAIATATQSARWQEFKTEKAIFPFLRYQTAGDDSVRDEHRLLDGITKRVDDPFWRTYYPPNGWHCRCEAIQVPEDEAQETPEGSYRTPPVPELFRTNVGETGLIFPRTHPYYMGVPNMEIRKAIAYLPPENAYLELRGKRNVPVNLHVMHGVGELQGNLEVINDLIAVKPGIKEVSLLPEIHSKDNALKPKFYPDGWKFHNKDKNADAVVNFGKKAKWVVDIKRLQGNAGHLKKHLEKAAQQADYAIIKLSDEELKTGLNKLKSTVNFHLKITDLKGVIIIGNDGSLVYESYKIQPPIKK